MRIVFIDKYFPLRIVIYSVYSTKKERIYDSFNSTKEKKSSNLEPQKSLIPNQLINHLVQGPRPSHRARYLSKRSVSPFNDHVDLDFAEVARPRAHPLRRYHRKDRASRQESE